MPTVILSAVGCANVSIIPLLLVLIFVQLGVTIFVYFAIFLLDFLNHSKLIFKECGIKRLFYAKDPLRFRTEFLLYLFGPVVAIIPVAYITVLTGMYLGKSLNASPNTRDMLNYLLPLFLLIMDAYSIGITTLFPFFLTIHGICRKKPVSNSDLGRILADPNYRKLFESFCKAEFSSENLLCYDDVQIYKNTPPLELLNRAHEIYNRYISFTAPIEVNVSGTHRKEVYTKIQEGSVDSELFADVERDLMQNMYDTFSRFCFSEDFIKTTERENMIKEI
jgi:hypothetical protein